MAGGGVDEGGGGNCQWGLGVDGEGERREERYLERDLAVWRLDFEGAFEDLGSLGPADQSLSSSLIHFLVVELTCSGSVAQPSSCDVHLLSGFFDFLVFEGPWVHPEESFFFLGLSSLGWLTTSQVSCSSCGTVQSSLIIPAVYASSHPATLSLPHPDLSPWVLKGAGGTHEAAVGSAKPTLLGAWSWVYGGTAIVKGAFMTSGIAFDTMGIDLARVLGCLESAPPRKCFDDVSSLLCVGFAR